MTSHRAGRLNATPCNGDPEEGEEGEEEEEEEGAGDVDGDVDDGDDVVAFCYDDVGG